MRAERFGEREFADRRRDALRHVLRGLPRRGRARAGGYPGMLPFPAIANPDFLAIASDEFIADTIRHGPARAAHAGLGRKDGGLRPRGDRGRRRRTCGRWAASRAEPDAKPARWVQGRRGGRAAGCSPATAPAATGRRARAAKARRSNNAVLLDARHRHLSASRPSAAAGAAPSMAGFLDAVAGPSGPRRRRTSSRSCLSSRTSGRRRHMRHASIPRREFFGRRPRAGFGGLRGVDASTPGGSTGRHNPLAAYPGPRLGDASTATCGSTTPRSPSPARRTTRTTAS